MVVYSKTGTTGKIVRMLEIDGKSWAELDSTGLLYDTNTLEATTAAPKTEEEKKGGQKAKKGTRETKGSEEMKDEGSLDSSAGVCGAG